MRLVKAEILKLRRRRGLMIWSSLMTVGSVVVALGVMVGLHMASPDKHGPAGGASNLMNTMWLLSSLGGVAAILIGVTAGSQDSSAGVFRDLVVTGRSRRALFDARIPGALVVYLPMLAVGFATAVAGAYAFAGSAVTPTAQEIGKYAIALFASNIVMLVLAVALGSMISSRIATGVLIGWKAIVAPLLIGIPFLGAAREGIDLAAAMHFAPTGAAKGSTVAMSSVTAAIVLVVWAAVARRAGVAWTRRVDA